MAPDALGQVDALALRPVEGSRAGDHSNSALPMMRGVKFKREPFILTKIGCDGQSKALWA